MARPNKEISQKQFESLCRIQCTQEEICSVLGVCEDTLLDWCKRTYSCGFSEIFKQKRNGGKASLRRRQWLLAKSNATMAIWLGKQYLGQTDNGFDTQSNEEQTIKVEIIPSSSDDKERIEKLEQDIVVGNSN